MLRVVAYYSVSTEKEEQLDSLEKEKKFFEKFAGQNNYQLVDIYADEGRIKNSFNRMMKDAQEGKFDITVVKDISRFTRDTLKLITILQDLRKLNIEVQVIDNNYMVVRSSQTMLLEHSLAKTIYKDVKKIKQTNDKRRRDSYAKSSSIL